MCLLVEAVFSLELRHPGSRVQVVGTGSKNFIIGPLGVTVSSVTLISTPYSWPRESWLWDKTVPDIGC